MSAQSNGELMRKGYDAFSRGDMETLGMSSSLLTLSGTRVAGIDSGDYRGADRLLACSANCFS